MTSSTSSYTIVFTDSGLGGLSIMTDFFNSVKQKPLALDDLNIIFFNALQESGNGYNSMPAVEDKIHTFNGALQTLEELYSPDQVAIACNTLSSLYPQTAYAKIHKNTLEIISCGRSMISDHLQQFPDIPVFVLATPTTISSAAYSIKNDNVYYISGDNLASLIEFNYMMPELKNKVIEMFAEIKSCLRDRKTLAIFFGCTHYAYIANLFRMVANEYGLTLHTIIDPAAKFNRLLIQQLPAAPDSPTRTRINLKVESQAQILNEEIVSVSSMVKDRSPEITRLLQSYKRLPKTF